MNIDQINKKRKQINALSLTITIMIFIVFLAVEILFFRYYWWVGIVGVLFVIASLYLLSKLLIKPLYNKVVLELIKLTFNDRYRNYDFSLGKSNDFIFYLFNKDYINLDNCIKLKNNDVEMVFNDIVYENKAKKSLVSHFYGKSIKLSINNKTFKEEALFSQNKSFSDKFIEVISPKYKNSNNNIYSIKKSKPYMCFYNEEFDTKIIEHFDSINDFVYIQSKDNIINIFYISKEDGFNFKLTDILRNDVTVYIKEKYKEMFRIIDCIIQEVKNV